MTLPIMLNGVFLVVQTVKNPHAIQETQVRSLGPKDPLDESMATHCDILAWRIPGTGESNTTEMTQHERITLNESIIPGARPRSLSLFFLFLLYLSLSFLCLKIIYLLIWLCLRVGSSIFVAAGGIIRTLSCSVWDLLL